MRLRRSIRTPCAVLGALFLSGCYTWVPVDRPVPGSQVRVHLTPANASEEERTFSGVFLEGGDSLLVVTDPQHRLAAYPELVRPDSLRVAGTEVTRIDVREFSAARSVGLSALVVGGAALLILGISSVVSDPDNEEPGDSEPPPPVNGLSIPLLRLFPGR